MLAASHLLHEIKDCIHRKDLRSARRAHALLASHGLESDAYLGGYLIRMFVACDGLPDANAVFCKLYRPNVYAWSEITLANTNHGQSERAIRIYYGMREESLVHPDKCVFVAALKACVFAKSLADGKRVHCDVVGCGLEQNVFIRSSLVDMYAKCGSLGDACDVFYEMPTDDVVVWNAMMSGYASHGHCCEALELLHHMQIQGPQPNHRSWTAILSGYAHHGHDRDASQLIQQMSYEGVEPNLVTWNALISGYVLHGRNDEAIQVFSQMFEGNHHRPDKVTYLSLVKASASKADLQLGKLIHNQMIDDGIDISVAMVTSLIDMYAKCGSLDDPRCLFERLLKKDVVAWNSIISGYVLHGCEIDAFDKFRQMQEEGTMPDVTTLLSILKMCSLTSALNTGMLIHSSMIDDGMDADEYVVTSLIDLYAGSGMMRDACKVFDMMPKVNLVSWNALMAGYAISIDYPHVDKWLEEMQSKGLAPDGVTFVSLLSSCGYLGLIDEGSKIFNSMMGTYGVPHSNEHVGCMVDLLGGSGFLLEAEDFLHVIPYQPTIVPWTSLLNSCRAFNDVDIAEHCFEHVVDLDESCASAYALMSIIYSTAGMGEDSLMLKEMRQHSNAWKKPGRAYIELQSGLHSFVVGDDVHPQCEEIYRKLEALAVHLKKEGHVWLY